MALKIHALHVGSLVNFPAAAIKYHRDFGKFHDVAMIMFVITGGEHTVVVDTGTGDPEHAATQHGYELHRPPEQEPLAALEGIGVDPASVGTVVNTHLHWDHCSNNDLFPQAEVLIQQKELQYAIDPLEPTRKPYERLGTAMPSWLKALNQVRSVDGDAEVFPGVGLVHIPGHTPGSQGVLVDTGSNRYVIAGDCVDTYENWNGDDKATHIPNGSFTDLEAYMRSFRKLDRLGAAIVPSHDIEVVKQAEFS